MATATITGNTPFHDLASTTGITTSANLTALQANSDAIGDHIRVTNADNAIGTVTINIQGTNPVDMTGRYVMARLAQNNANRPNDYYLGFQDGSGNEKRYTIFTTPSSQDKDVVVVLDLSLAGDIVDDAGFNQTDVTTVLWYTQKNGGGVNSGNRLYSIEYTDQLTITGGTTGDRLNNSDIKTALATLADFPDDDLEQPRVLSEYLLYQHSLKIGDGVADGTWYNPGVGGLAVRENLPYSNAVASALHYAIIQISDGLKRLEFDLADTQTIENPQSYLGLIWVNSSAGVITWQTPVFADCQSIDYGSGILRGANIQRTSGVLTGAGSLINSSISGNKTSGAELTLESNAAIITNTTIESDGADYHLELGTAVTAITLPDVELLGTTTLGKIHVLATTGTVTITATGATNVTAGEIVSDGATVNLVTEQTEFRASALTSVTFDNVRCRLSLAPGNLPQINDDGSVASGAIAFAPGDVSIANNTIDVAGVTGKLNSNSVIRIFGSDVPDPLDPRAVYYPSVDYAGGDLLSLSSTPGGATIGLTNTGSLPQNSPDDLFISASTELDISLVAAGDYVVDLSAATTSAGVTLVNGDILVLQAIHHDPPGTGGGATLSNYLEESFQYSGASIVSLASLDLATLPMSFLAELGLDGSQVTGFSVDAGTPSKVQVDISTTKINTLDLVAFYYFVQWSESGMRFARGNIDVQNSNSVAVRGELTIDAATRAVWSGPFAYRLDGESIIAPESEQVSFNWEDTRAAVITQEVAIDLPSDVLQMLQSILYLTSRAAGALTLTQSNQLQTLYDATTDGAGDTVFSVASLANAPSGGGGGGDATLANQAAIIAGLTDIQGTSFDTATDSLEALRNRGDNAWTTATGFSTHGAADVWANPTRELTTITPAQITAIATGVEAAIINEGDGQQVIDAILQVFNANLDLPALELAAIATAVRTELTTELARIDVDISSRLADSDYTQPLTSTLTETAVTNALSAYDPPTRAELTTDTNSILSQGNSAWVTGSFNPATDPVIVGTNNDKTGYTINQAFPTNFDLLAIDGSGNITAGNMRGTDGALTSLGTLPNVTVGGYAVGQAPNELIDISTLALETTAQACLSAATALTDGRYVEEYADALGTQYNADGSVRKVFDLFQADGVTPATGPENAAERRPRA